jgi:hypothetical protein
VQHPTSLTPPIQPRHDGQERCRWQRCTRPASDHVYYAQPHRLAGQVRGYCGAHAFEASQAPGAILMHRRPVPTQLSLLGNEPGTEEPAGP